LDDDGGTHVRRVGGLMKIRRFRQRSKLGIRYVKEYLMDEVSEGYGRSYLPSRPLDVICEISYVCNLECPTCFRWTAKPDEHELTADQWKAALLKLKNWLGTFNLTFTGGEPFLRKDDILDIFRFASDNGIVTGVVSNGSLIDKDLARRIVASGLDGLTLSLNSMIPEVHNKTRGTNGAFDEVMRAIDNLSDRKGMRLVLSTTIVKDSIKGLIDVVEFVKARGLYGINFQPIMPASILPIFNKDGQTRKIAIGSPFRDLLQQKDNAHIDSVFDRLVSMKAQGYPILNSTEHLREIAKYLKDPTTPEILEKVCKVGIKNLNIDPFGNVRLCSIMEIVGNITTDLPQDIWRSVNAAGQRENIRTCDKTCRLMFCNYKKLDFKFKAKRVVQGLTG
jgi:MoaA/NifB/PqqE/SkfB family radical SAM enzyme